MPGSWSKSGEYFLPFQTCSIISGNLVPIVFWLFFASLNKKPEENACVRGWISGRNNATWFSLSFCYCTMCILITNLAFSFSIQYPLTQWIKRYFLATTNSISGIFFSPQLRFNEQLLDTKPPGVLCIATLRFKDWRLIQQTFIDNSPRSFDRHELGLNTRKKIGV